MRLLETAVSVSIDLDVVKYLAVRLTVGQFRPYIHEDKRMKSLLEVVKD